MLSPCMEQGTPEPILVSTVPGQQKAQRGGLSSRKLGSWVHSSITSSRPSHVRALSLLPQLSNRRSNTKDLKLSLRTDYDAIRWFSSAGIPTLLWTKYVESSLIGDEPQIPRNRSRMVWVFIRENCFSSGENRSTKDVHTSSIWTQKNSISKAPNERGSWGSRCKYKCHQDI